jgi:hypothetical protein
MKRIYSLIIVMTLCLSIVLIGFESNITYATGGNDPPIGPNSMQAEYDDE